MYIYIQTAIQLTSFLVYFFLCTVGEIEDKLSKSCTFMASLSFCLLMMGQCRSISLYLWRVSVLMLHKQTAAFLLIWSLIHVLIRMIIYTKDAKNASNAIAITGYILLSLLILISFTPNVGSNRYITWIHSIGFFFIIPLWIAHGSFHRPGSWIFLICIGILFASFEQIHRRISCIRIPVQSVIRYTPHLFSIELPVTPQLGDIIFLSPNFYEISRPFIILPSGHVIVHARDTWSRAIRDRLYSQNHEFIKEKWLWMQGPFKRPLLHLPKEKNQVLVLVGGGTSLSLALVYFHAMQSLQELQGEIHLFASFKSIQNASWFLDRVELLIKDSTQIHIHICFTQMITLLPGDLNRDLFTSINIICGQRWNLSTCFKDIAKTHVKDQVVYASLYKPMDLSVHLAMQGIIRLHRVTPKFAALSF